MPSLVKAWRTCPGCDGPLARGAQLCRRCRKRALEIGIAVLLGERAEEPITPGQMSAIEAKLTTLSRRTGEPKDALKALAYAAASRLFGRTVTSKKDLSRAEAGYVLDRLADELA